MHLIKYKDHITKSLSGIKNFTTQERNEFFVRRAKRNDINDFFGTAVVPEETVPPKKFFGCSGSTHIDLEILVYYLPTICLFLDDNPYSDVLFFYLLSLESTYYFK